MKKIYTLFIVLFCSILFGQEYRPMLGENNFWEVDNIYSNGDGIYHLIEHEYRIGSQTIVHNEKEFKAIEYRTRTKLFLQPYTEWSNWGFNFYLYENIEEKKVYIYYLPNSGQETGEYLLYDFNLNVGDVIPKNGFSYSDTFSDRTITSISYEEVFGIENVKVFHTIGLEETELKIYEGLGAASGINTLSREIDNIWELTNFTNTLGLNEQSKIETKIYPNPFSDKIQIQNSEDIIELQLFDLQGKLISMNKNLEELNSKLSSLSNAVYFLKIQFKNNKSETIKLIKNK